MHQTLCILGGSGFVGRHLAYRLVHSGFRVRILSRHPERHQAMATHPDISVLGADVHDTGQLTRQLRGMQAVINLTGILNDPDRRGRNFHAAHIELPRKLVIAAQDAGVQRLLHMSALNASADERHSRYLQTKGEGEDLVHEAASRHMIVTSFRPSVIFGAGDGLFSRFARLLKYSPVLPLACPDSRFAPVWVNDVAEAITRALHDATGGERLELCGPEVFTLRALVEYTRDQLGIRRIVIGLGDAASRLQARLLGSLPGQPFTLDNYHALQHDSVCSHNALPGLGISPTPVAAIVPGYLAGRTSRARYDELRRHARRD